MALINWVNKLTWSLTHIILSLYESISCSEFIDSVKLRGSRGKLVDAYRYLHKEKDMERGFSWSGNPVGK